MTRLGLIAALLLTGTRLHAGLTNANLTGPGNAAAGQVFTMSLSVYNPGPGTVTNLQASIAPAAFGFSPTVLGGPSPASVASAGPGSYTFVWAVSGTGCGTADFNATANGVEGGSVSASSNTHQVSNYCTPTPTPTPTPVLTATPTPWVVYISPPANGDARILGNLFRPLLGSPLQLQADLPEAGALVVELFDRLGHRVKRFELNAAAGPLTLNWDGRSDDGLLVASGIYVAQFRARKLDKRVKFAVLK
jgi:hypothetical protein